MTVAEAEVRISAHEESGWLEYHRMVSEDREAAMKKAKSPASPQKKRLGKR
jgi:hypothetical protein